jgi:hypothetical protein
MQMHCPDDERHGLVPGQHPVDGTTASPSGHSRAIDGASSPVRAPHDAIAAVTTKATAKTRQRAEVGREWWRGNRTRARDYSSSVNAE